MSGERSTKIKLRNILDQEINPATEEKQDVIQGNLLCLSNSTNTPLGIDGVFTGEWIDTLEYGAIVIGVKADQNSATDGLLIQWSGDGVVIGQDDVFTILANTGKVFTFTPAMRYFRIIYTNDGTTQTSFALQTIMKKNAFKPSSHRINDSIVGQDDAELMKAVITGEDDNGVFQNVKTDLGGLMRVNSFPYAYSIAEGDILGHDALLKFGTRTSIISNIPSTIWEGTAALYPYIPTATTLSIVSTSTSDSSAGTGIRTLTLIGLDVNYNEVSETITMNGTTAVITTNTYKRIFRAFGATSGTNQTNVGTINVTASGVQVLTISPGDGQTLMTVWTVPAGKVAYLVGLGFSSDTGKGARISLFTRLNDGILYPWQIKYRAYIEGGANNVKFTIPFKIPAKTDIEVRFNTPVAAGTTSGGATFELWYEDV